MKNNAPRDTVSLAGWLFADLLLGLSMIFLIINFHGEKAPIQPTLTPTATNTPAPTLSPTIIPTIKPSRTRTPSSGLNRSVPTGTLAGPGLSPAQCYNINLDYSDVRIQDNGIVQKLKSQIPDDPKMKAGLVLVWAHGKSLGQGVKIAHDVGELLQENFPSSFGNDTQIKSLYFDTGDLYHVQLEVYFINTNSWDSGFEVQCEYIK